MFIFRLIYFKFQKKLPNLREIFSRTKSYSQKKNKLGVVFHTPPVLKGLTNPNGKNLPFLSEACSPISLESSTAGRRNVMDYIEISLL